MFNKASLNKLIDSHKYLDITQTLIHITDIPPKDLAVITKYIRTKPHVEYSYHIRAMYNDWQLMGSVSDAIENWNDWAARSVMQKPGTYALVYGNNNEVFGPGTLFFGETTQRLYKRIYSHVSALSGCKSNTSDKYRNKASLFDSHFKTRNLLKQIDKITVFVRPHDEADSDWHRCREHSTLMETQANAFFKLRNGHTAVGNTRDLPSDELLAMTKKHMEDNSLEFV